MIGRPRIRGPRAIPPGGWPLDDLFVGVVTLRTMREMFARDRVHPGRDWRPSRLSLRVAGSLRGCTKATRRLERAGLLEGLPPTEYGRARSYRLDRSHPLVDELAGLFRSEWVVVGRRRS